MTYHGMDKRDHLTSIKKLLDWVAPILKPALVAMMTVTLAITAVFLYFLIKHSELAVHRINWEATSGVGDFLGGILGPLLSAISSILLVITLIYTAHEYELSRKELAASVQAQIQMADAQSRQEDELKEQTKIAREESHLNMALRSIEDLKKEERELKYGASNGMEPVLLALISNNKFHLENKNMANRPIDVLINDTVQPMVRIYILHARAQQLWRALPSFAIHPSQVNRCKLDLLAFVKNRMATRELLAATAHITDIVSGWNGERELDAKFREFGRGTMTSIVDSMEFFFKQDILQIARLDQMLAPPSSSEGEI